MAPLLIFAGSLVLMWVLLILPRQRQLRAHQEVVRSIEVGDEVMTTSGLYGTITAIDEDDVVHLEVAPGTTLRFTRGAVAQRVGDEAAPPEGPVRPAGTAADRAVEPRAEDE